MGRVKKHSRGLFLILALFLIVSLGTGCQTKMKKDTASQKTEVQQEKEKEEELEEADESGKIPDNLLPGQSNKSNGAAESENAEADQGSVFDASDEGITSGKNPGTKDSTGNTVENSAGNSQTGGNSTSSGQGESESSEITVSITVDSATVGNPVSSSGTLTMAKGATAYDALVELMDGNLSAAGGYVAGIGGLSEKDYGSKSGWMYFVNGSYMNKGSTAYVLKDGDSVQWRYTTDLGNDL